MLVTTSDPGNRFFERKGTRCLSVGTQSVFGCRLHTPAQTGEEQSNQCYLDEGFTRLYFSLVILA